MFRTEFIMTHGDPDKIEVIAYDEVASYAYLEVSLSVVVSMYN